MYALLLVYTVYVQIRVSMSSYIARIHGKCADYVSVCSILFLFAAKLISDISGDILLIVLR